MYYLKKKKKQETGYVNWFVERIKLILKVQSDSVFWCWLVSYSWDSDGLWN